VFMFDFLDLETMKTLLFTQHLDDKIKIGM